MKKLVGVTFGFLLSVPAVAGDVYTWLDEQGQVHFGDRPPVGVQAVQAAVSPAGGDEPAPGQGLRSGERAWLSEIEKQERRKAAERREREKRAAAEEKRRARQADRDAQRCAGYRRKIREYERRLRAGCRVSTCNSYQARIDGYEDRAAQVCR